MRAHPECVFLRVVGMFVLEKACERQMETSECERGQKRLEMLSNSEWGKLNNERSFDRARESPF